MRSHTAVGPETLGPDGTDIARQRGSSDVIEIASFGTLAALSRITRGKPAGRALTHSQAALILRSQAMGLAVNRRNRLIAPTDQHRSGWELALVHMLLIGAGGFAGAIARYAVDRRVSTMTAATFPWGTLLVNLSGSFVLGFLFALVIERASLPPNVRGPLMIGFLGAYTTFSTLMLESWRMIEEGAWMYGLLNLAGSILLGMLAVVAGVAIGRLA